MTKEERDAYTDNTINHKGGIYIGRQDFNESML